MKRSIATLSVAAFAMLAAIGCTSAPVNMNIHGTEIVSVGILDGESASDAYPDVTSGSQVTVVDSSHKVIGNGTLSEVSTSLDMETFKFTVSVPEGLPRYGIQVGNSNRGTVWFSQAQMKQGPGLCLGDGC